MSPVLPREREVWLSRRSVASLGVYSVQWPAEKQRIQLAATQQNRQQIIYKTAFPSTCRLLTVWTFKYEHNSSVNMLIVCYSDTGSALNETKQQYSQNHRIIAF